MKFKHNQKVTCEIYKIKITDARISIDDDGQPYICQNEIDDHKIKNKLGYKYSWGLSRKFTNLYVENLLLAEKTFDYPELGDEYKNRDGDSKTVLGVCGQVIFLSNFNDKNHHYCGYTKKELIECNYTIVQDEPEEEIEELTVAEVCKRLGKTIKIIK